jgi:hypothetical protein
MSEQGSPRSPSDQAILRTTLNNTASNLKQARLNMYDAFAAEGLSGWAAVDSGGYHGTTHDNLHYGPTGHRVEAARMARFIRTFT